MILFLLTINTLIFTALSALHIYWAAGGKWGMENAVPQRADGAKAMQPGKAITFGVAVVLLCFAWAHLSWLVPDLSGLRFPRYVFYLIGAVFFLRVMGDFRYVGLFKTIRNNGFARQDDRLYIPLCAYLSLAAAGCGWLA